MNIYVARRQGLPRPLQTGIVLSVIIAAMAVIALGSGGVTERFITGILVAVVFLTGLSIYTANTGIMSFGHVAFMAIGAYVTMYLTMPAGMKTALFSDFPPYLTWLLDVNLPFWLAVPISGAVAALLALIVSPTFSRLRGLPAGIATLSLLVVIFSILSSWEAVTRGSSTLVGIPRNTTVLNISIFIVIGIIAGLYFTNSKSGLQLRAAREDYEAAVASGVNVPAQMGKAWLLSAFFAGAAGAFYAGYLGTFSAATFFLTLTFSYVVMIVIGGYLSLSGAVVGAIVIGVFQEMLRRAQDGQFGFSLPTGTAELAMSVVLIIMLIIAPMGIMRGKELTFTPLWRKKKVGS